MAQSRKPATARPGSAVAAPPVPKPAPAQDVLADATPVKPAPAAASPVAVSTLAERLVDILATTAQVQAQSLALLERMSALANATPAPAPVAERVLSPVAPLGTAAKAASKAGKGAKAPAPTSAPAGGKLAAALPKLRELRTRLVAPAKIAALDWYLARIEAGSYVDADAQRGAVCPDVDPQASDNVRGKIARIAGVKLA